MNKDSAARPIGVFDSGVGGLTVLRALSEALPREDFLYLGDTARLPYGTKSGGTVTRYAIQASRMLTEQGVKLLVVACNTASSVALPALEAAYPEIPVVGVVEPGARASCMAAQKGRIAVIATGSTVKGGAYQNAIRRIRPDAEVATAPCALFVSLAEEGWTDGPLAEAVAKRYLDPLMGRFGPEGPDCLVLGCTHFPVLAGAIANVVPRSVRLIDSARTTTLAVAEILADRCLVNPKAGPGVARFFATDDPERFSRVGEIFLGRAIAEEDVIQVDL